MSEYSGEGYDKCTKKYPKTIKKWHSIEGDMLSLFCKKQLDYGPNNIAMGGNDELALLGIAIRMNDKVQRLLTLLSSKEEPNNESIEDTFQDIGNYAIMAQILRSGEWGK